MKNNLNLRKIKESVKRLTEKVCSKKKESKKELYERIERSTYKKLDNTERNIKRKIFLLRRERNRIKKVNLNYINNLYYNGIRHICISFSDLINVSNSSLFEKEIKEISGKFLNLKVDRRKKIYFVNIYISFDTKVEKSIIKKKIVYKNLFRDFGKEYGMKQDVIDIYINPYKYKLDIPDIYGEFNSKKIVFISRTKENEDLVFNIA